MNLFFKTATKSRKELVEEIHTEFDTEVDRLLASAKIYLESNKDAVIIDKASRLKNLGFTQAKETTLGEKAKEEKTMHDKVARAIEYFSFKYPNYKFITEESVQKICAKYNLIYGSVEEYTGVVPCRNLEHIEKFKIEEKDECGEQWFRFRPSDNYCEGTRVPEIKQESWQYGIYVRNLPLEIAAPPKDFTERARKNVKGFKIESRIRIPDPVVIKPVHFEGSKFYLIVTAWGEEASDDLVVNQKFN